MKSRFCHQHAVDYLAAWNRLSDLCMFQTVPDQDRILRQAKDSILFYHSGTLKTVLTETDKAHLAAVEEMMAARRGNGGSPDVRSQYVVEIGTD